MTLKPESQAPSSEERWREFVTTGAHDLEKRGRRFFSRLPDSPR